MNIKKQIKEVLLIGLVGFPAGFLFCGGCLSNLEVALKTGFYSSFLWILMWKGNELLSIWFDSIYDWLKYPGKRLVVGIVGHAIYPAVLIFLLNFGASKLFGWNLNISTVDGILSYAVPAVIITYLICLFLTAWAFFKSWKQSAVEKEVMKREVLASQYETLKSQVNPHFLFNSLNVLTSLVYKDADTSANFIRELSNVYRYVLDVSSKELVPLEDEVKFLESYVYLMKMRHTEGLYVDMNLPPNGEFQVAPLVLQMLVENAIKHNAVSKDEPLHIKISHDSENICVTNNLQVRGVKRDSDGSNLGLHNINARYKFLTDQPVDISKSQDRFEVRIPLLKVDEKE